jgi:GT2 family glycosyltransferase
MKAVACAPGRVSAVIPYRDTPAELARCLETLVREPTGICGQIIVVDNASATPFVPSGLLAERVTVVRNERNRGFAASCNQGAAKAAGDLLFFLNSDAELLAGSLAALVAALDRAPELAAVAPQELRGDGKLVSPARRFLGPFDQALGLCSLPPGRPARSPLTPPARGVGEAPWVSAAGLLVRSSAFHALGGFDEGFFFYEEDEDLCWRLRRRGWRVAVSADAIVRHEGGASTKLEGRWPALALYAGQLRFVRRRGGVAAGVAYRLGVGAVAVLKSLMPARSSAAARPRPTFLSLLRLLWLSQTTVSTPER